MAIEGKLLQKLEPTIELDKLKFKSYGEQEGENPGDANTTREMGVEYPLIVINGYRFKQSDINSMEISIEGVVPTINLSLTDSNSTFKAESYPRDGDVINVRIASRAQDTYKDVRIDFDIDGVESTPRSGKEQGLGGAKYSFTGKMKVPGLYAEQCKSYGEDTTINHLETIASELQLGFATNIDTTDDSMPVFTAYEPMIDTIDEMVKHSYVSEDSFQTFSIDPWYNLTYVDLNKVLNSGEDFETAFAAMDLDFNDILHEEAGDDTNQMETPLILSSHNRIEGSNMHISKFALKNKTGKNVKSMGYKRVLQYFENDSEEGIVNFDVEPLTTSSLKKIEEPLKGRRDEERYKTEIKYKYAGRIHSDPESTNTHLNYNFAKMHNAQNLSELDKMTLEIELSSFNPSVYRYQRVPVAIFAQTQSGIAVDKAIKNKKDELGFETKPQVDTDDELADQSAIDEFLSGFYVVGSIKYIYKKSTGLFKQKMTLLRREWPTRLNNIEGSSTPSPKPKTEAPKPTPKPEKTPEVTETPETPETPEVPEASKYTYDFKRLGPQKQIVVYEDGSQIFIGDKTISASDQILISEAISELEAQHPEVATMQPK